MPPRYSEKKRGKKEPKRGQNPKGVKSVITTLAVSLKRTQKGSKNPKGVKSVITTLAVSLIFIIKLTILHPPIRTAYRFH